MAHDFNSLFAGAQELGEYRNTKAMLVSRIEQLPWDANSTTAVEVVGVEFLGTGVSIWPAGCTVDEWNVEVKPGHLTEELGSVLISRFALNNLTPILALAVANSAIVYVETLQNVVINNSALADTLARNQHNYTPED